MPLIAAACLSLVGCPQALSDDFTLAAHDADGTHSNGGSSHDPASVGGGSSGEVGGTRSQSTTLGGGGESSGGSSETVNGGAGVAGSESTSAAGAIAQGGVSSNTSSACQIGLGKPNRISFSDGSIDPDAELSGPSLSPDGLTLFFVATQTMSGIDQIYRASRSSVESLDFSAATAVFASATEARGTPALSSDGLTLYFQATRWNGMGDRDIWFAKRASTSSSFGELQALTAANTSSSEHSPFLTQDQLALYYVTVQYSSYYGSTTNSNVWRVTRTSTDQAFGNPTEVEELNSAYRDQRVAITANGRVVYFSSDRADTQQLDLWTATRATQRGTFEQPVLVTDARVNTTSDERDVALSADDSELFFVSNRDGETWIYRSLRGCP